MSEIETYDEPSNADPLDETMRANVASDPRDYFEAGLLIGNLRKRLAEVEKERDEQKRIVALFVRLFKVLDETVGGVAGQALRDARSILDSDDSNHGGNIP